MATITLAGVEYSIRPLTLGQLRIILPAFAKAGALGQEGSMDAAIDIIVAALARDHGEITRALLLDTEMMPHELTAAVGEIARISGLIKPAGDAAGEAEPAATRA